MVGGSLTSSARAAGSDSKAMPASATGASAISRRIMFLSESFRCTKYRVTGRIMSSPDGDSNAPAIFRVVLAVRDRLPRSCSCRISISSGFEDGEDLSFGDNVVETDKNQFKLSCRRGRDRDFHLHRFDERNVVAVADASPDLDWKRAHAPGDLGHYLDVRHFVLRDSRSRAHVECNALT